MKTIYEKLTGNIMLNSEKLFLQVQKESKDTYNS
jgi:hypothetical protein